VPGSMEGMRRRRLINREDQLAHSDPSFSYILLSILLQLNQIFQYFFQS
jgi:hypothetical protein